MKDVEMTFEPGSVLKIVFTDGTVVTLDGPGDVKTAGDTMVFTGSNDTMVVTGAHGIRFIAVSPYNKQISIYDPKMRLPDAY